MFAEEILGIHLNAAQKRWFRFLKPGEAGWEWRYKLMMVVAANQIGKTVGLAILILWACLYKIGIPTDSYDQWLRAPYQWFHVGPDQNRAYLVLQDIEAILKGAHLAQLNRETMEFRPCRLPAGMVVIRNNIETYYRGLEFWNGAIAQFRTTEDRAKSLLGRRANGISFDEAAFEPNLKVVVSEVLLMRTISTGGPVILVSTPDGINDFFELVSTVLDEGTKDPFDTTWHTEDRALVWATIADNIGFGVTQEEVDRMEANLDPVTKEQQLRGAFLEPSEAFFVPSAQIVKAFREDLPESQSPKPGHKYVIFCDPSVSSDPTAIVVLDITVLPWVGVHYEWLRKPIGLNALVVKLFNLHVLFNGARDPLGRIPNSWAVTGWDATSMGGAMIRESLAGISPSAPINFGGTSKIKFDALTDLRAALARGRLILPASWTRAKREILNYRIEDKKIEQDSVMALAGAVKVAVENRGPGVAEFRPHGRIVRSVWQSAGNR